MLISETTSREYIPYPTDGVLETEFGPMHIQHLPDVEHPTVALGAANGKFITIDGVRFGVRVTLTNYRDGAGWVIRRYSEEDTDEATGTRRFGCPVYVIRKTGETPAGMETVNLKATGRLRDTLPALFNEWAAGKEPLFVQMRLTTVLERIRKLNGELHEAEALVEAIRLQRRGAEELYSRIEEYPTRGDIGSGMVVVIRENRRHCRGGR